MAAMLHEMGSRPQYDRIGCHIDRIRVATTEKAAAKGQAGFSQPDSDRVDTLAF